MNYKPFILFFIIFLIIVLIYFFSEKVLYYFPIHIWVQFVIVIIGILGCFAPKIMSKINSGENFSDIKEYIIMKYKKN